MSSNFLKNMSSLNKAALAGLIFAKIFGLIGVALGFIEQYHSIGAYFLILAFIAISLSIVFSIMQGIKDKKSFMEEDEELDKIKMLNKKKKDLERQIKELEDQHNIVYKLKVTRSL